MRLYALRQAASAAKHRRRDTIALATCRSATALSVACLLAFVCPHAGAATFEVGRTPGQIATVQAAVERARAGDTILIHDAVYRETVYVRVSGAAAQPITIQAAPGAHPVITGADPLPSDQWQATARAYIWRHRPWTYRAPSRLIGGRTYVTQQVIEDGRPLADAPSLAEMTPGSFFADPDGGHALCVWLRESDAPSAHRIEVSVRPLLMEVAGSNVIVRGLTFRYASNNAQQPAFSVTGTHDVAEDCTIEMTAGEGADLSGSFNVFRRMVSRDNGQMGMAGHGSDNLIVDSRLGGNNTLNFPKGWEAGGIKVAASRRFRILHSVAVRNNGPGFWFDIDNENGSIEQSYAGDNDGPGIQIEISSDMAVRNNLCVRNGLRDEDGAWNYAGILVAESMRVTVEHNITVENRTGIEVRQQGIRELPAPAPGQRKLRYYSDKLSFLNNICAFNREWQFALFGDNPFFGSPGAVSPADLRLYDPDERGWRMNRNDYYAPPGSGLIVWGAPWHPRHQQFQDLRLFQRAHGVDLDSLMADPDFLDPNKGDLRLGQQSLARRIGAGVMGPVATP